MVEKVGSTSSTQEKSTSSASPPPAKAPARSAAAQRASAPPAPAKTTAPATTAAPAPATSTKPAPTTAPPPTKTTADRLDVDLAPDTKNRFASGLAGVFEDAAKVDIERREVTERRETPLFDRRDPVQTTPPEGVEDRRSPDSVDRRAALDRRDVPAPPPTTVSSIMEGVDSAVKSALDKINATAMSSLEGLKPAEAAPAANDAVRTLEAQLGTTFKPEEKSAVEAQFQAQVGKSESAPPLEGWKPGAAEGASLGAALGGSVGAGLSEGAKALEGSLGSISEAARLAPEVGGVGAAVGEGIKRASEPVEGKLAVNPGAAEGAPLGTASEAAKKSLETLSESSQIVKLATDPKAAADSKPAPEQVDRLGNSTLKTGSQGDDVKALQEMLNVKSDGVFGPQTEQALKEYQANNGLVADGVLGGDTRGKLTGAESPEGAPMKPPTLDQEGSPLPPSKGGTTLGSDGKPVPSGQRGTTLGPDGKPVPSGQGGTTLGPDGKPVPSGQGGTTLGPDGKPVPSGQGGTTLGPDGKPVPSGQGGTTLGPDGKPSW